MDPELFQNLLYALATAIVGLLAYAVRSLIVVGVAYLKARLTAVQFEALAGYAQTVVRYLEQSDAFKLLDGSKKKELAIVAILKYAEEMKIPVDRELIDKIIEASVRIVKKEIGIIEPLDEIIELPGVE